MVTINNEQENVLKSALDTFGETPQVWMAIEEMAELSNAIAKKVRGRVTTQEVAEEVADVFIMMQQLAICNGQELVQECVNNKIKRLNNRIEKTKYEEK